MFSSSVLHALALTIVFHKSDHFDSHLPRWKERVRLVRPKNVYQFRKTLFEKLEGFILPLSEDNKLFNNLAFFGSICVPTEELMGTQTTTCKGKHVPISVSISLDLVDEHILLYNDDP